MIEYDDEEEPNFHWMEGDSLAPPCQSEIDVIQELLEFFSEYMTSPDLTIYDIGCGDGRICIEANKKFGSNSIGIEIEEFLIKKFETNINKLGLQDKVQALHKDLREVQFIPGSIIGMYLLPESIEQIKGQLVDALNQGCILVCNTWGPKGLTPIKSKLVGYANNVTLTLYTKDSLV